MTIEYLSNLYHKCNHEILLLIIMVTLIIPLVVFIRRVIFAMIQNYITKWCHSDYYQKTLKKYSVYTYLLHTLLSIYFIFWGNILHAFSNSYLLITIKNIFLVIYTGGSFTMLILAMIDAFVDIYQNKIDSSVKYTHISLYIHILKIVIACIAIIIIISNLLNISLSVFFTSLGAVAAVLTFVFKDTVMGLLASLQIISQDIMRIGDIVTIAQYNVEGTVEKITIAVVRIKNFDQTISIIPTSGLLNTNIVNLRGINESMAKRIQRSIYIDLNSIIFVPPLFIEELKKSSYLSKDAINRLSLEQLGENMTNIKIFRLYVMEYLKNNPAIYQQYFPFLVRELSATADGLPIELYVFTNQIKSDIYEEVQADIFDHLFAVLPEFKLKIFQNINNT